MSLEPYFGRARSVPQEYIVPVPAVINNILEKVTSLPKTTSGKQYSYFEYIELIESSMFYAANAKIIDGNINYYQSITSIADDYDPEIMVVDPNSIFMLPNAISSSFSYNYETEPSNGLPLNINSEEGTINLTGAVNYWFGGDSSGCVAINPETAEVVGRSITPFARIKFKVIDKANQYSEEKTFIANSNSFINLAELSGVKVGINAVFPAVEFNSLGYSDYFKESIYIPKIPFGLPPIVYKGGRGYYVPVFPMKLVEDYFDYAYPSEQVNLSDPKLYYSLYPKIVWANTLDRIKEVLQMTPEELQNEVSENVADNPYYPNAPSAPSGGGGNYGGGGSYYPTTSLIPEGSAEANDSNAGLYTRYLVGIPEMQAIGDYFWAEDLGLQIAKTAISLLYGDPVSTVISCVSFPFALDSVGIAGTTLKWGGHDTGVNVNMLSRNATQINWGTIQLSEYWGNFLDYSPHTKMQLYLPWGTGFVDIDPNDVMNAKGEGFSSSLTGNGTLSVITNIELSRGLCVHHVIANDTVIGTYSGSCGRQIPITGSDYGSKQVAIAGAAIGAMAAGAVSAGLGAVAYGQGAPALYGSDVSDISKRYMTKASQKLDIAQSEFGSSFKHASKPAIACAAAVAVSPPHVSRSGSFQEGAGSLSPQKPFLVVSRPKMSLPKTYGFHYGYPSNITSSLSSISGYTEIGSIHLDGILATSEELKELDSILSGGVIL